MNKPKQATLFQSWGNKSQSKINTDVSKSKENHPSSKTLGTDHNLIDLCAAIEGDNEEDEDIQLARAMEESLAHYQNTNGVVSVPSVEPGHNTEKFDGNISFGIEDKESLYNKSHCLSQCTASDVPMRDLEGFNHTAGDIWIYPTNYPVREYQFSIVKQSLIKNTLVTLPTGLGKTFIASVVMYNFYRWYPEGKIVFMAPTKPLVAQQIEACYDIMGIPKDDTAEMTGIMNPTERQKAWQNQRVFFLTPQILTNDLSRGTCQAQAVKCLVIDEAHKALGNHAYCQVVRELVKYTRQFRVLALSATPGSDIKAVQQVMTNLLISHIELRLEESADLKPYTHERTVEKIVVPLGGELSNLKNKYIQMLSLVTKRLIHQRVLYNREPASLSKFLILKAREAFRQNPPENMARSQYGVVEGDFALALSLYHGYELLQLHGLRSLFNFLDGIINGDKAYGRTRSELLRNADFTDIIEILQKKFQPSTDVSKTSESNSPFLAGHPKMVKLEKVLLDHFQKCEAEGRVTRVMIFSQYRDSVHEITEMLQQHQPLLKVMSFIGQSSAGKTTKGFTQKEQLKVMQAFRKGSYNTLVSTCVGEEGLDIGDVDLIICFDAHKSPIRLVQRMGRTGRKREGRIVMLVTEGKEEQIYNQSQHSKRSIYKAILNGAKSLVFYPNNPRMLPSNLTPACHRMHITVGQLNNRANERKHNKGKKTHDKLSTFLSKGMSVSKKAEEDGGISLKEFRELRSGGLESSGKMLPKSKIISIQPSTKGCSTTGSIDDMTNLEEENDNMINCVEWLPWQNSLQQTIHFGHSRRSHHLVELLEFIDLQQMCADNEDNYGQEMKLYLDLADVSDRNQPNSIAQLCTSTLRDTCFSQVKDKDLSKKLNKDLSRPTNVPVAVERKKKKESMFTLEQSSDEDSDVLPDVDFSKPFGTEDRFANKTDLISKKTKSTTDLYMSPVQEKGFGKQKRKKFSARRKLSATRSTVWNAVETEDLDDFAEVACVKQTSETYSVNNKFLESQGDHVGEIKLSSRTPKKEVEPQFCLNLDDNVFFTSVTSSEPFTMEDIQRKKDVFKNLDEIFIIPSPPCEKDIPFLLDSILRSDDFLDIDLESVMTDFMPSFSVCVQAHSGMHAVKEGMQTYVSLQNESLTQKSLSEDIDMCAFEVSERNFQSLQKSNFSKTAGEKASIHSSTDSYLPVSNRKSNISLFKSVEQNVDSLTVGSSKMPHVTGKIAHVTGKNRTTQNTVETCTTHLKSVNTVKSKHASYMSTHFTESDFTSAVYQESQLQEKIEVGENSANGIEFTPNTLKHSMLSDTEEINKDKDYKYRAKIKGKTKCDRISKPFVQSQAENHHLDETLNSSKTSFSESFYTKVFLDDDDDDVFPDKNLMVSEPQNISGVVMQKTKKLAAVSCLQPDSSGLITDSGKYESCIASVNALPALSETSKNDSLITFTQALACIQSSSSSEPTQIDSQNDSFEDLEMCEKLSCHECCQTEKYPNQLTENPGYPIFNCKLKKYTDRPTDNHQRTVALKLDLLCRDKPATLSSECKTVPFGYNYEQSNRDVRSGNLVNLTFNERKSPLCFEGETCTNRNKIVFDAKQPLIEKVDHRDLIFVEQSVMEKRDIEEANTNREKPETPNFDLGFDFDEDIIPPSPHSGVSLLPLCIRSQKSATMPATTVAKDAKNLSQNAEEFDDDYIFMEVPDKNLDEHSPCFTSSFQIKSVTIESSNDAQSFLSKAASCMSEDKTLTGATKIACSMKMNPLRDESDLKCLSGSVLDLTVAKFPSQGFQQKNDNEIVLPCKGFDYADASATQTNADGISALTNLCIPPLLHLAAIDTDENEKNALSDDLGRFVLQFDDFDDDFDGDLSDRPKQAADTPKSMEKSFTRLFCSTPVSSKKVWSSPASRPITQLQSPSPKPPGFKLVLDENDSDFEESFIVKKKRRIGVLHLPDDDSENTNSETSPFKIPSKKTTKRTVKHRPLKKRKAKRRCAFLDEEAEESDDVEVSSDEEDDNLDALEGSFIDNATQPSHTDMKAVYLKSVQKSPSIGIAARFHLRYNQGTNDAFSQLLENEEESHYCHDSFCVGSDDADTEVSADEITLAKAKKSHSTKRTKKDSVRQVVGRKRIHHLAGSSSSDGDENSNRLPLMQTTPLPRTAKAARMLLSSSDENLDLSAVSKSPTAVQPNAARKLLSSSDENLDVSAVSKSPTAVQPNAGKESMLLQGELPAGTAHDITASQGFFCPSPKHKKPNGLMQNLKMASSETRGLDDNLEVSLEMKRRGEKLSLNAGRNIVSNLTHSPTYATMSSADIITHRETIDSAGNRRESILSIKKNGAFHSNHLAGSKTGESEKSVIRGTAAQLGVHFSDHHQIDSEAESADRCGSLSTTNYSDSMVRLCSLSTTKDCTKTGETGKILSRNENCTTTGRFTNICNEEKDKVIIFVDSREISSAQDIISELRLHYNTHVYIQQLSACDYILSNRLAVDRFTWSLFISCSNRSKLSERVRQMQILYDRCVVIIEKDRLKLGEEKTPKLQNHSKYVDTLLAHLNQTSVRVFFTENQGETAAILANLGDAEKRKGMAISVPVNLSPEKEQIMKFYLSIPLLTITHALNLCFNFKTIQEFLHSSVSDLQAKGKMSFSRASEVSNFVRHRFSLVWLSNK